MAANTIGSITFDYMTGEPVAAMSAKVREFERTGWHGKGMVGVGDRPQPGRKTCYKDFAPSGWVAATYEHMDAVRALANTIVTLDDENGRNHEDVRVVSAINRMPKHVVTTADGDRYRVISEFVLERTT